MPKHFGSGYGGQAEMVQMLKKVQADKQRAKKFMDATIDRMWIELGNCCGLQVEGDHGMVRPLGSRTDLRVALKAVTPDTKLHMLLHFMFNYVRDTLYPSTLMVTHQWAVEQAALVVLNVKFEPPTTTGIPPKTCLAKLYGEVFNDRKQRLMKSVIAPGYTMGVEHKGIVKPKGYKRKKHTFFVHRKAWSGLDAMTTEVSGHTTMVDAVLHRNTNPWILAVGPTQLS